jgi:hypothetical protein
MLWSAARRGGLPLCSADLYVSIFLLSIMLS